MSIHLTQYVNNQFGPKNLASQIAYLSANYTLTNAFDTVTGLSITVAQSGWYDIVSVFTYRANASADDGLFQLAIDGSQVQGTNVRMVTTSGGIVMFATTLVKKRKYLTEGEVVAVEGRYTTAGGVVQYLANQTEGTIEISEVQAVETPNTYPFLVNANSYELGVSGTNWVTSDSWAIFYKTLDGSWFMDFSINGSFSSGSAYTFDLTVSGVVFDFTQEVSVCDGSVSSKGLNDFYALAGASSGIITVLGYATTSIANSWYFSGRVKLASKPTIL